MKVKDIRQSFFDFFNTNNHKIVSSAPMVIKDDPTLMFTNAGMNQFKDYFLGNKEAAFKRVYNSQKCLRVSGKHNDLEEVGKDTYHHTMFEMLGSWSFGDYFKEEAIDMAWKYLTEVCKLDKSDLYVTVFEGDKKDGIAFDQEAFDFWKKHIDEDRVINGNKKDNFWEMGDVGPCGTCSEIHVDLRSAEEKAKASGKELVNKDHPQVVEIWNLVFVQFNRAKDGKLSALPNRHVDTGMGLERLAMALQKKESNYDTDVFAALIEKVVSTTKHIYGKDEAIDIAIRVIVDHIRAIAFSIADGQLPSNKEAGYVIRRILRRAVRYAYSYLNYKEPLLFQLVPTLINEMGDAFNELKAQSSLIEKVIKEEEQTFLKTLDKGIQKFDAYVKEGHQAVKGKFAFELYDTFGFPIDLTQLMAEEQNLTVAMSDFTAALEDQKNRSRKAAEMDKEDWTFVNDSKAVEFVGYDQLEVNTAVQRYRAVSQKDKTFYHIVLDQTPFYAESGGQAGDKGILKIGNEEIPVFDTKKENDLIIHFVEKLPLEPNAAVTAIVNENRRRLANSNHSATHLMHHALRTILGDHVEQKGSFLNDEYLRFDFTHFAKVTEEELAEVESIVNKEIQAAIQLEDHRAMAIDDAKSMGAMALFGEKYGDLVRVVKFGNSVELCGGTHVANTSSIGLFKFTNETAVAAGVRRVEALTSAKALTFLNNKAEDLDTIKEKLKNPKNIVQGVDQLLEENNKLKKQLEAYAKQEGEALKEDLLKSVENINGTNFVAYKLNGVKADIVKDLAFQVKSKVDNLFLILGNEAEGKATITIAISDELAKEKSLHAGKLVRELAKEIKGGGGGQPFFATAGGKDPNGIENALEKAKAIITENISMA
jgi:alanyl-tRNA synthetase